MKGRVVVVAGSTQGIGLAISRAAAHAGAEAIVVTVARLSLFLMSEDSEPMSGALIDYAQFVFGALD